MEISYKKQFFLIVAAFFVLGASFKVMVLVEGLTEVRPVNAIPQVAGFAFGPIGAFACAVGNLLADLFGTLSFSSILGVVANFIAAFLPYRLWHLFSDEQPNLHTRKNILKFIMISLINSFTTAWVLSFGLFYFFGNWIDEMYSYIFFNNLGFSIGLGMPIFIILTSESIDIKCHKPLPHLILNKNKIPVCITYTVIMLSIFIGVFFLRINPGNTPIINILSALALAGLICQII